MPNGPRTAKNTLVRALIYTTMQARRSIHTHRLFPTGSIKGVRREVLRRARGTFDRLVREGG